MLSSIFRGRFRSRSTPERKLAEIETLSSANPEQLSRLRALSEDEEPSVRLAAARHIGLRDQLCKLLVRESDPTVRTELINDLFNQVNAADEREIAALLVRHARDPQARRQLLLELPAPSAVTELIRQSEDDNLALDIACTHRIAAVRLAAAELVSDADQLQQLARSARDKSVQQHVRSRQRAIKAAESASAFAAERTDRLISASAKLVESVDTVDYTARIQALQVQLQELGDAIGDDQRHIVERNLQRCRQRAQNLGAEAEEPTAVPDKTPAVLEPEPEETQLTDIHLDARSQLLTDISARHADLDFQDRTALESFVVQAQNRWAELHNDVIDSALQKRFAALTASAASAAACHKVMTDHAVDIDKLLDRDTGESSTLEDIDTQQDQLAELLAQLDWPGDQMQPARLQSLLAHGTALASELDRRRKQQHAEARKLDRFVYRLRGHVQRKQLKSAVHALREIDELIARVDPDTAQTASRKLASTREALQQLKDWEDFSARPKREELCEKMEALQASPLAPDAQAEAVKSMRQAWRTVGAVPLEENDPLRERFQSAADAAFAHCAQWHERQQQIRAQNLAERERLVAELETFLESVDWDNPDLDVLNRAQRASRDEWRHYYPVRHSDARACQKNFDALMDRLSKAIKRGQRHNVDQREQLILQAEALAEATDLDQAIQQAIALQNEWKRVGPVRASQQRQQWKRFRKPMDALFAKRNAERDTAQAETNAKVSAARDALAELRALAGDQTQPVAQRARAAEDVLASLESQLATLPTRERKAVERDAAELLASLHSAQRDAPRQRKIERLHALASVAADLAELDAVHQRGETPDTTSLISTLDQRIGENTTARALIEERLETFKQPYSSSHAEFQFETVSAALIEIEILAELDTPDAWRAERRACQIEMLEDRSAALADTSDALYALCERALATGPIADTATNTVVELDATRRLQKILDAAPRWLQHA